MTLTFKNICFQLKLYFSSFHVLELQLVAYSKQKRFHCSSSLLNCSLNCRFVLQEIFFGLDTAFFKLSFLFTNFLVFFGHVRLSQYLLRIVFLTISSIFVICSYFDFCCYVSFQKQTLNFPFVTQYVMHPHLQSTYHEILSHYVEILHLRLGLHLICAH